MQQGADELKLSRIIDTGKVIIPKPKVLDDLPDELVLTGAFIDAESKSPLIDLEFTLVANGRNVVSTKTTNEGAFEFIVPMRKIDLSTAKAILAGKFSFGIKM